MDLVLLFPYPVPGAIRSGRWLLEVDSGSVSIHISYMLLKYFIKQVMWKELDEVMHFHREH